MRDDDGNEREATAAELKELGPGWQKVYRYRDAGQLTKGEAKAAGLHPTRDRGLEWLPTVHLGPNVAAIEKRPSLTPRPAARSTCP